MDEYILSQTNETLLQWAEENREQAKCRWCSPKDREFYLRMATELEGVVNDRTDPNNS